MTDPLPGLAQARADELEGLAQALAANRLSPPFSSLGIARFLPTGAEDASADLARLSGAGMIPAHIALLLSAVAAERRRSEGIESGIELVTTGPDATAGSRDTGVVVRDLFAGAQRSVLVVGFAVHSGRQVFATLAARLDAEPAIAATLCLDITRKPGDTSTEENVVGRFADRFLHQEWPGNRPPPVYYDPRSLRPGQFERSCLHAKCVVIDETQALVTSANFTEAAQVRNIELGLLLRSDAVASGIVMHFRALIDKGFLVRIPF
jgi:phosphatidylserine/phosphatidylglycerophosphate/cardiolipin synthase-like enzyme